MRSDIRSQNVSTSYQSSNHLAACAIFGIYSGPIADLKNGPDASPDERLYRLLLDPALRAPLRGGAASRARRPSLRAARPGRRTPALASLAARAARGCETRPDREPGDRLVSHAPAVRTRPGLLRRAIHAIARRAERREPGRRAGRAGAGVRGDGRLGATVRSAGQANGSDSNAECGMRNAEFQ